MLQYTRMSFFVMLSSIRKRTTLTIYHFKVKCYTILCHLLGEKRLTLPMDFCKVLCPPEIIIYQVFFCHMIIGITWVHHAVSLFKVKTFNATKRLFESFGVTTE